MQMTMDGAGLVDIGNMGTQIANVNQDTTAEFTYLNAAFGADTPRGPTIIQITSKAAASQYHGDAVYICPQLAGELQRRLLQGGQSRRTPTHGSPVVSGRHDRRGRFRWAAS